MIKIDEASYQENYRISIRFNDGRSGTIDARMLIPEEPKSVFAPLADEVFARGFKLEYGTLCWPGELDVAPEYLYILPSGRVSKGVWMV